MWPVIFLLLKENPNLALNKLQLKMCCWLPVCCAKLPIILNKKNTLVKNTTYIANEELLNVKIEYHYDHRCDYFISNFSLK